MKLWDIAQVNPGDAYCQQALKDQVFDLLGIYPDFMDLPEGTKEHRSQVLSKLMKSPEFASIYEEAYQTRERFDEWNEFKATKRGRRFRLKTIRQISQRGHRLGIDKLVVFNPTFNRMDIRKKGENPIQYVAGEQQQTMIREYLLKAGNDLEMDITVMDSRSAKGNNQVDVFNDLMVLEAWKTEKNLHDEVEMAVSNYGEVQKLVEKYGTPYFVNTGVISIRGRRPGSRYFSYLLAYLPILWPYMGYETVRPEDVSIVYSFVYDMNKGELMGATYNAMRAKIKNEMLYHSLYFDLYQMKSKKRK